MIQIKLKKKHDANAFDIKDCYNADDVPKATMQLLKKYSDEINTGIIIEIKEVT